MVADVTDVAGYGFWWLITSGKRSRSPPLPRRPLSIMERNLVLVP
jgi:hypothetical protein